MQVDPRKSPSRSPLFWFHLVVATVALALIGAMPAGSVAILNAGGWVPFSFLSDTTFHWEEQVGLFLSLTIAIAALVYAWVLGKRVFAADQGTKRMQEIAEAVRDGSNAYLRRQFTTVGILLIFLTILIVLAKWPWEGSEEGNLGELQALAAGRGIAFFVGAIFSASVGFFGMRLATTGNLRVAAAARRSFAESMKLAYQTGTVTGMLTAGLGLLGGCLIVLVIGEKAYEALLGFAFGGSLLALFMRVGGGIYTKAADVGADLVGKIEANIPEDDPRNAATIADNVGDNVGDCAGMAADVFESYTVTMVAAMILGYAAFGPKAMMLPLFIQAIGILSSMVSTNLVGRSSLGTSSTAAMSTINNSFRIGAGLCVVGFFCVGALYLRFDGPYIVQQAIQRGLAEEGKDKGNVKAAIVSHLAASATKHEPLDAATLGDNLKLAKYYSNLPNALQKELAGLDVSFAKAGSTTPANMKLTAAAQTIIPITEGFEIRPILALLVGIVLTLALMFCTEYWTSTDYTPVKSITKASRTGHATNIIQGIAIGYESTVWAVIIIAGAIFSAVYIFQDTSPIFAAYGVSLCGIGMLALTGDTLSMDVFGPVADNANGIGEMGYNRDANNQPLKESDPDHLPEREYENARQILTDLDATGNTTKAITKGIAIGSAVIAAVSLFASFIAVLAKGSEEKINQLTSAEFYAKAGLLSVAYPDVFIGMLIGGAVPFLFSSMTIRAVGRAAYLIVNECRRQFKNPKIWDGTEKPDYSRVVGICTNTAQKELVGPGLLAIFTPITVGFLLGPYALGGFLAGMMVVGQLLAVFMATAGGAWDNAKKMIEDQPKSDRTGKGSEMHKSSVTGDTVGDPLKDTAGPAINPLIKVMNMVSLLVLPLVMVYNIKHSDHALGYIVIAVGLAAITWAWWQSKRDTPEMHQLDLEYEKDLEEARAKQKAKNAG
ncbi:MAG: sodium/proton-translocating pyrophosphatase [Planctomycetes bacterium]|nr:sodium/proton-translocating pyrophosphatase [Planctomycetota bacterium]